MMNKLEVSEEILGQVNGGDKITGERILNTVIDNALNNVPVIGPLWNFFRNKL